MPSAGTPSAGTGRVGCDEGPSAASTRTGRDPDGARRRPAPLGHTTFRQAQSSPPTNNAQKATSPRRSVPCTLKVAPKAKTAAVAGSAPSHSGREGLDSAGRRCRISRTPAATMTTSPPTESNTAGCSGMLSSPARRRQPTIRAAHQSNPISVPADHRRSSAASQSTDPAATAPLELADGSGVMIRPGGPEFANPWPVLAPVESPKRFLRRTWVRPAAAA